MSKLAYGPPSWHVLASTGPPSHPLHFYATSYSTHHRRRYTCPVSLPSRHRATGYASNFHPAVYYSPKLDAVDNPTMGQLLRDNYDTQTCRDYVGYRGSSGREPLPSGLHHALSGFAHNLPRTIPTTNQARRIHVDTAQDSSVPVYPRHNSLLHSLRPKDPITTENAGHGPMLMSTEYHTKFPKQPFRDEALGSSRHSHKEETGFTHAHNVEPITFRPHENHTQELPGHMTWRPTGSSIVSHDFRNPLYMKGSEPLGSVSARADWSNGYVKGNKAMADVQPQASEMVGYTRASQLHPAVVQRVRRRDPAEFSILTHPHQYASLTQRSFRGEREPPPSETRRLDREEVGRKELTGFSENMQPFVEPRDGDTHRFVTHYQNRFGNPNPAGSTGMVPSSRSQAHPSQYNGFSKSTKVHRFGEKLDTARILQQNDPYVARSIMKRDPYFDDHTHDCKAQTA